MRALVLALALAAACRSGATADADPSDGAVAELDASTVDGWSADARADSAPVEAVPADAAAPDARADSAAIGPAGAACPPGPYGSPLPPNVAVTMVRGGFTVTEGPVWLAAQHALYFSEFEGTKGRIHKYTPADGKLAVFVDNVGVNGLTMDERGMILAGSQDMQRLTRFDPATGARSQLAGAESYQGKPFNAVNDVIARADGNIYFSDPTFLQDGRPGQGATGFYRLWNGVVTRLGIGKQPNALGVSLDGRWLYVTSSAGDPVRRFPLAADGSVGPEGSTIAVASESLALDCAGNLYLSSDGKVRVFTAEGQPLGTFADIPAGITNLTFGDDDGRTLYITARAALYQARLGIPGLPN